MKKTLALVASLGMFVLAMATVKHWHVFESTYHIKPDSNLGKDSCMICHTSMKGGKLNPYGKDIKAILQKKNTKVLTADILKEAEKLDSTKSGETNGAKIRKDINPGKTK